MQSKKKEDEEAVGERGTHAESEGGLRFLKGRKEGDGSKKHRYDGKKVL